MGATELQEKGKVPFYYRHFWKNVLLLLLSVICIPLTTTLVVLTLAVAKLHGERNRTFSKEHRKHRAAVRQRKTILVTGVSMTKGLTIARNLSQHTPHRIIGADISALSPGRFSSAIARYYRLDTPNGDDAEPYIDSVLTVLKKEKVDLWISCSSVVAAVEDGQIVRLAEKQATSQGRQFEAVQFREDVVERLHEKDKFIEYIEKLGLPTPESHRCTTPGKALDVLMRELHSRSPMSPRSSPKKIKNMKERNPEKEYIMKPIGVDDQARNNMMTLLPFPTIDATAKYIRNLNISKRNPFQLQQFIKGTEYCTHALVIRGEVKAFTSCPSSELLMHYEPLPPKSRLSREMLKFTKRVCEDGGRDFSGHLSFDFLIEDADDEEGEIELYPIECNPRAHTAVVLFDQTPEMADAYLSIFQDINSLNNAAQKQTTIFPRTPTNSYYWAGHDLVEFIVLPILDLVFGHGSREDVFSGIATAWRHLACWKDGTLTLDDPWPFFVLYHVYWPAQFLSALVRGRAWSRINVSTTKMFQA